MRKLWQFTLVRSQPLWRTGWRVVARCSKMAATGRRMALRSCLVSCRDQAGDAYAVQVTAESLYDTRRWWRPLSLACGPVGSRPYGNVLAAFRPQVRIHPPAGAGGWRWPSPVRNESRRPDSMSVLKCEIMSSVRRAHQPHQPEPVSTIQR